MRSKSASYRNYPPRRAKPARSRRKRLVGWLIVLPFLLWLGVQQMQGVLEQPQAILVLGGSTGREKFAADFAQRHSDLPIWISSGTPKEYAEWVFSDAGIDLSRLHLDYRAVDTVTNFTTLVDDLQQQNIRSVYLITSDYHMRRAQVIGEIVFGSRGIRIKPVSVPTDQPQESLSKALRDGGRAILWVATGRTGAELNRSLSAR